MATESFSCGKAIDDLDFVKDELVQTINSTSRFSNQNVIEFWYGY